ncbi:hypothetical protein SKAU_G00356760 [Synaphobranchus kaupii]|uniref:Carbonic anhydrase n=1 Tax=Synaphobranchus kaupii TaxID=118154 RepID=A0A9Q1EHK4_SYNKA|nr:hypothetical protein SKAU_G00356760 [Synaphobranchus kaupii]
MLGKLFLFILFQILASSSSSSEEDESSSESGNKGEHPKSSSHGHWNYLDQDAWSSDFQHCSGQSQSPINIATRQAIFDPQLPEIKLEGYDLSDSELLKLVNNGHTLQLNLPDTMRIVSGFDNIFLAAQLHFHWGTIEAPGSEHTIDNVHFPAEIHVVHYNSKYHNISEAASKLDGLAVLGAFIGIGLHENENYEKILSSLMDVSREESDTEIPGFNVRNLLPNKLAKFYRYNGSLTTPPCYQTVNWTIFNDTITVSRKQLASLEDTLKAGLDQHLTKNFRAPQLLYNRQVMSSFRAEPSSTGPQIPSYPDSDGQSKKGRTINEPAYSKEVLSRGDILAIVFGALFTVTLLSFMIYACQQRKKTLSLKKDTRQNVIYKPATKEEV